MARIPKIEKEKTLQEKALQMLRTHSQYTGPEL